MRVWIFLVVIFGARAGWSEGTCFRTTQQAAVQVGEAEGGGYRLLFVRVDPFGGRAWAGVRSCVHPEWPVVLIAGSESMQPHLKRSEAAIEMGHPDVVGGKQVKVVIADSVVRMEMTGTAMGSGRIGDRVWVRIFGADGGVGRLELGLVQGVGQLEVGR